MCHVPGKSKGSKKICNDACKNWKGFKSSTSFYQYEDCPDVPEPKSPSPTNLAQPFFISPLGDITIYLGQSSDKL